MKRLHIVVERNIKELIPFDYIEKVEGALLYWANKGYVLWDVNQTITEDKKGSKKKYSTELVIDLCHDDEEDPKENLFSKAKRWWRIRKIDHTKDKPVPESIKELMRKDAGK